MRVRGITVLFLVLCCFCVYAEKCYDTPCGCCKNGGCDRNSSRCVEGCLDGYTGYTCTDICPIDCVNCSQYLSSKHCYFCNDGFYNGQWHDDHNLTWLANCNHRCRPECKSCNSYSTCTECTNGYYKNETFQDCRLPCHTRCVSCLSHVDCTMCQPGYFGQDCSSNCAIGCLRPECTKRSGGCDCKPNFRGHRCNICIPGKYGSDCDNDCPTSCSTCLDGTCTECKTGYFGNTCDSMCEFGCFNDTCRQHDGDCIEGCKEHFSGVNCDICVARKVGALCEYDCPEHCVTCAFSGLCTACSSGYAGKSCDNYSTRLYTEQATENPSSESGNALGVAIGSVFGLICFALFVLTFVLFWRKRRKQHTLNRESSFSDDINRKYSRTSTSELSVYDEIPGYWYERKLNDSSHKKDDTVYSIAVDVNDGSDLRADMVYSVAHDDNDECYVKVDTDYCVPGNFTNGTLNDETEELKTSKMNNHISNCKTIPTYVNDGTAGNQLGIKSSVKRPTNEDCGMEVVKHYIEAELSDIEAELSDFEAELSETMASDNDECSNDDKRIRTSFIDVDNDKHDVGINSVHGGYVDDSDIELPSSDEINDHSFDEKSKHANRKGKRGKHVKTANNYEKLDTKRRDVDEYNRVYEHGGHVGRVSIESTLSYDNAIPTYVSERTVKNEAGINTWPANENNGKEVRKVSTGIELSEIMVSDKKMHSHDDKRNEVSIDDENDKHELGIKMWDKRSALEGYVKDGMVDGDTELSSSDESNDLANDNSKGRPGKCVPTGNSYESLDVKAVGEDEYDKDMVARMSDAS